MYIFDNSPLGAATVVVDIDQMNDELRRLQAKPVEPAAPPAPEASAPASVPTRIPAPLPIRRRQLPGPVHRPSWGGRLTLPDPPPTGAPEEVLVFRCGRDEALSFPQRRESKQA
jgi:hypothetical protein